MKTWISCGIMVSLFFASSLGFLPSLCAQDSSDDIRALKQELTQLKQECETYKQINAKLEERLNNLEKKLETVTVPLLEAQPPAIQTPVSPVTTPQSSASSPAVSLVKAPAPAVSNKSETNLNVFDGLPAYLVRGFTFSGYFRSGYGVNAKGGKMEAFQAPNALGKYRLGNEQETYLETTFAQRNWNPNPDGPVFMTQIRMAYKTQQNKSSDDTNEICLREAYAEMGNFAPEYPSLMVWGGKRFYRLASLEIIDFRFYNLSGYGGGFQGIPFGEIGKLDISYIGYADSNIDLETRRGRLSKNNFVFLLKDVKVPLGTGVFWVNGGYMPQGVYNSVDYRSAGGVDTGFMHLIKNENEDNLFAIQYGWGSCISFTAGAEVPTPNRNTHAWRIRASDMYQLKCTNKLSLQMVGLYQYTCNGQGSKDDDTWASFGFRPVYGLTKYLALEVEPGVDYVYDPPQNLDSYLFKVTGALRLAPQVSFASNPKFRLFATYAKWGRNFKGKVGGGSGYEQSTAGINMGVQCEHSW